MAPEVRFVQPPIAPWVRNLLLGLFGLYVLELVLGNLRIDLSPLYLLPWGQGFAPWQPLTRFLVQGGGNGLFNVLVGLVVLYFALPMMERLLDRRRWIELMASAVLCATVFPLISEIVGLLPPGVRFGWSFLLMPIFLVLGLVQPKATVNLMFVLPVPASWIIWGSLIIGLLYLLASPNSGTLEPVSAWIGVMLWWNFRGPGARQRKLLNKAASIEKELKRFQVIEGGKSDRPLGGQRGPNTPPDEWVN